MEEALRPFWRKDAQTAGIDVARQAEAASAADKAEGRQICIERTFLAWSGLRMIP
jgi:hypothetical protein